MRGLLRLGVKSVKWGLIGTGAVVVGMYISARVTGEKAELSFGPKPEFKVPEIKV